MIEFEKMFELRYFLLFLIVIAVCESKNDRNIDFDSESIESSIDNNSSYVRPAIGQTIVEPKSHRIIVRQNKQFRILLWNGFFDKEDWGLPKDFSFKSMNCSFNNCFLTRDKKDLFQSDAVVFHWRNIDTKDLPKDKKLGQKWIVYNMESPEHSPKQLIDPFVKQIDWMATYRSDSDIYVPYGYVNECNNKWNNEDLFDSKSKSIAWIVSNCKTPSRRELYVKQLKQYIDVDIYGKCGPFDCPRDPSCINNIVKTYKFYLSFENSVSFSLSLLVIID